MKFRKNLLKSTLIICSVTTGTAQAQFEGPFDLSNWILTKSLNTSDAHVDLTKTPDSFTFFGSNSGTGRASSDKFSLNTSTLTNLSTLTTTILFPTGSIGPQPTVIGNYEGNLASTNINFDWTYQTSDLDGPAFDSPVCSPMCNGFNQTGPSTQSGHTNITFSDVLVFKNSVEINPNDGFDYSVLIPVIYSNFPLFSFGINTSDSNFGGAQLTISNFSYSTSYRNVSGVIATPLPTTIILFANGLGFLGISLRKRRRS